MGDGERANEEEDGDGEGAAVAPARGACGSGAGSVEVVVLVEEEEVIGGTRPVSPKEPQVSSKEVLWCRTPTERERC